MAKSFKSESQTRIARAVKAFETDRGDLSPGTPPTRRIAATFWVKITDSEVRDNGIMRYAWVERERTDSGEWQDKPNGRSGGLSDDPDRAAVSSDVNGPEIPIGYDAARMVMDYTPDSDSAAGMNPRYTLITGGGVGAGELAEMAYKMRTNNSPGWDFIQLHPPVPGVNSESS